MIVCLYVRTRINHTVGSKINRIKTEQSKIFVYPLALNLLE